MCRPEVVVQQEYGGEVAGTLAPSTGPALVRGDVAMAVVRAPEGDRELRTLPSCFSTCAGMVRISVLTAKGYREPPPEVASQVEQAPPGPSGMQAARRVMRQQGWREGQVQGAGQTGPFFFFFFFFYTLLTREASLLVSTFWHNFG